MRKNRIAAALTALVGAGTLITPVAPIHAQQAGPAPAGKQQASAPGECPDQFASLDENKQISQAEERSVRLKVFASLDSDRDSVVSREEYVKCLGSTSAFMIAGVAGLGGRPDEMGLLNRTEGRFLNVDANKDGRISWDEYMKAAQGDYQRFGKVSGRNEQGASAAAGWAFARMDTDLSGDIVMKEWTADAGLVGMADASFRAMDANKDGKISQDEYHAAVEQGSKSGR